MTDPETVTSLRRRVLVVEDDLAEREALARLVARFGYDVEVADSAESAVQLMESLHPAVVMTDLVLPGIDGLGLLQQINASGQPSPAVLVMTGHASIESAVEAMRRGAYDFLTKPLDAVRLEVLLEKATRHGTLTHEVTLLRHQLRQKGAFGRILGESKPMQEVYRWIELSAASTAPVLIHGESGTGKELIAQSIHAQSGRSTRPLVAVNCAAIPESLIESELFGHERGAFTGAIERRAGCFELADGGTLFLDEIAEMDPPVQAKLLRVLQEGTFRRVGGKGETKVNVRIIAATNRDPSAAVAAKQLREDLFYRLNVFPIAVPPLRERGADILAIARAFIDEFNRADGRDVHDIAPDAQEVLLAHGWPGNVRQLRNVIQRAVVMSQDGVIRVEDMPSELSGAPVIPAPTGTVTADVPLMPLRDLERAGILRALRETNQDKARAASILGITVRTLNSKLADYHIS